MSQTTRISPVYFGKIPSRGDFVRSGQQGTLIQTLDRWLTQGIELMAIDPRWKEIYDRSTPVHFAFLGIRSRVALAGHLVASTDASGRRFPFIAGGSLAITSPDGFLARSPMALARPWRHFRQAAQDACSAADAGSLLADLAAAQIDVDTAPHAWDAGVRDFLDLQTVGSLEALLRAAGHAVDIRQTLLALGLLLQPIPASGSSKLEKGLRLPLPRDALYQPYVATLWLELVSRFLRRGDFEIVLFISQDDKVPPALSIGFSGGSPAVLKAMLDPNAGAQVFVDLCRAEWAETHVRDNHGVTRLSNYLQQPQLSLKQAQLTFCEAFAGE